MGVSRAGGGVNGSIGAGMNADFNAEFAEATERNEKRVPGGWGLVGIREWRNDDRIGLRGQKGLPAYVVLPRSATSL